MNIIQLNKLSKLHDGKNVIFCKTDFLAEEFKHISSLENEVVLITGNSDYAITDQHASHMPNNVKVWYAQNCFTWHPRVQPIPMGIENKNFCYRDGHGIGYTERVTEKERLLSRQIDDIKPTKSIYANFQIATNMQHRVPVMNACKQIDFIEWDEPTLSLEQFFDKILDYQMVVCPVGNGLDTHRLWEILYSNRIPITIKVGHHKIYKLYEKLPIIILDCLHDLYNKHLIREKFIEARKKNDYYIDCDYWLNEIKCAGGVHECWTN